MAVRVSDLDFELIYSVLIVQVYSLPYYKFQVYSLFCWRRLISSSFLTRSHSCLAIWIVIWLIVLKVSSSLLANPFDDAIAMPIFSIPCSHSDLFIFFSISDLRIVFLVRRIVNSLWIWAISFGFTLLVVTWSLPFFIVSLYVWVGAIFWLFALWLLSLNCFLSLHSPHLYFAFFHLYEKL